MKRVNIHTTINKIIRKRLREQCAGKKAFDSAVGYNVYKLTHENIENNTKYGPMRMVYDVLLSEFKISEE